MHQLSMLLIGALLFFSAATASPIAELNRLKYRRVCETDDCVIRAAGLLQDMDKSVNPCDDFYEFACGNFIKRTRVPEEQSSVDKFSEIADQLNDQLHRTFEKRIDSSDIKPFRMVKKFYDACMDVDHVEETSEDEMKALLRELGGWPVLEGDEWDEDSFDWSEISLAHHKNGLSHNLFVSCDIGVDMKNTTKRYIEFDQANLGLSQKYLSEGLGNKIVKAYYDLMVDLAVMLGADRSRASSELLDAFNFEMALAKISLPMEERRDAEKLYNPIKFSQLNKRFRGYDWANYVNRILEGYAKLENDDIINIGVPKFLDDVIELINRTPKRVQSNYAHWRVVLEGISAMSEKYHDRLMEFNKHITGQTTKAPRWKKCVSQVAKTFSLAVGSLYVRQFFEESAKTNVVELIDGIRASFRNILYKIDWMDDKTRAKALEKLENIVPHIAFPEEFLQDSKIEEYYEKLEQLNDSFFQNRFDVSKFNIEKSLGDFKEPVNNTDWRSHSLVAIVNAFYMPWENSMMFPAGILQGVFFGKNRPAYMNYGAIGWVIGHEITHGFDDRGRQFDKNGNLIEWWAEETKKHYLERAQCIIDQYGNYTVEEVGLNINSINTQGENIADNGGVKEAYYAYKRYEKIHGPELSLPGFSKYTSKQLFWLSAANIWCKVFRPEALAAQITTNVHSPDRYRVIGTFSNMQEFSKDYHCPVGSPMNPKKKCAVW